MHNARHHVRDFCRRVGLQRRRLFKAVAKARRKRLAAQKHFIAAWLEDARRRIIRRLHPLRQAIGQFVSGQRVLVIVGKDIDQINDEIRIRTAGRTEKFRLDAAGHGDVFSQWLSLINEHVRTRGRKTLILSHEIARIVERDLLRVRNGIPGIADVFVVARGAIAR